MVPLAGKVSSTNRAWAVLRDQEAQSSLPSNSYVISKAHQNVCLVPGRLTSNTSPLISNTSHLISNTSRLIGHTSRPWSPHIPGHLQFLIHLACRLQIPPISLSKGGTALPAPALGVRPAYREDTLARPGQVFSTSLQISTDLLAPELPHLDMVEAPAGHCPHSRCFRPDPETLRRLPTMQPSQFPLTTTTTTSSVLTPTMSNRGIPTETRMVCARRLR